MKLIGKGIFILVCIVSFFSVTAFSPSAVMAFEPLKGDLSKYDPNKLTLPTGDVIKIAMWDQVSGVNAYLAEAYSALLGFVAQDVNSQGGIKVDGKMKMVSFVLADTQGRPDPGKRAAEKAILQDKVNVFAGVAGSHVAKVGQAVAKEHKTIFMNVSAYSDELMDLPDWNEYVFRTCGTSATVGKSLAIFYEKRPETKFYILAQDYLWGHSSAGAFKKAIKEIKPNSQIVGEEYFSGVLQRFRSLLRKGESLRS